MDQPKSEHSAQTDKGYPHLPTQSGPVSQTYRFQVQSSASGCNAIRSLHHNTVVQSERLMRVLVNPLILFQTTPGGVFAVPQEIAGGGAVISLGYRCGRCGNKRGIYSSLFWLLWKILARGSQQPL